MHDDGVMRKFESGAVRDTATNKPDYEGFLSPLVLERYGVYMMKHQVLSDGSLRSSDNWQKGLPLGVYVKSAYRHFLDWWKEHRGYPSRDGLEDALCALLFNVMGYLHEVLKDQEAERLAGRDKKQIWVAGLDADKTPRPVA